MTDSRTRSRHQEIEADLRQKVGGAEWGLGHMLPGRRNLAREYGVSSLTIERAIDGLVREGLLRSDGRRGTFVAAKMAALPRSPRPVKHGTIGVMGMLYPDRQDSDYGHNVWVRVILQAVEHEFAVDEQTTLFTNTCEPNGTMRSLSQTAHAMVSEGIDGVVVVALSRDPDESVEAHAVFESAGVPSIFVAPTELPTPIPHVIPDSTDAGHNATLHLLKAGCEAIGYVSPFRAAWAERRRSGVEAACAERGLPAGWFSVFPEQTSIIWSAYPETRCFGYEAGCVALAEIPPRYGLVCANDDVALGVLEAAQMLGRVPGKDFLIVGFDDLPEARCQRLTSLRTPWDALGREAARLLRATLDHDDSLQVRLRWRLIPRASSRWHDSSPGRLPAL
ncbi:LacI family DNA-binding transcriptional regulator [soil metagenome]